jgi:hypothetical protein
MDKVYKRSDSECHTSIYLEIKQLKKYTKAMAVAGHGGLLDCEKVRTPHCLDSWLTDGSKAVSPTRGQPLIP